MKKLAKVILAGACMAALAGCTDATAKLNDAKTEIITVGKTSITKGDVYNLMKSAAGATTAVNEANKTIAAAEIEVTDEMKESAQSTLDNYKSMYGDSFTTYLEQNNMTEEDYMNDYLIPSLQAEKLITNYINDNWDDVIALYKPIKATVLTFTSTDDANAAKAEIDAGTDAATAASNHNSSSSGTSQVYTTESTSLDSLIRSAINSYTPDDGWNLVPESDGSTFDLVKVDDNDPNNFKDEAIDALESIDNVSSASTTYFFKKYNFHIYDKVVYDGVKADYPDNLVQDMSDDDSSSSSSDSSSSSSSN